MKSLFQVILFLKKHWILTFLFIYLPGVIINIILFENNYMLAFYNAAAMFALDVRVTMPNNAEWYHYSIYFLTLLAALFTVLSVFSLLAKNKINEKIKNKIISNGQQIVVFGLGENNKVYIDSELLDDKNQNILVIEKDKNNVYIEEYSKDNISIVIADGSNKELLKTLNLENSKYIVVSTGNDMVNLEISTQVLKLFPKVKLYVHIEDYSLRHFHKERGLISGENVKVYSYYEETARALFLEYDIDGKGMDIIISSESFSIAVVGNTPLAYEVIAQACIMGQLPNENKMKIYCISENSSKFQASVELQFTQIEKVPNVELIYVELDFNHKDFYTHKLWFDSMTNIILCIENDQVNLDIASNLSNITYLNEIVDQKMNTNILLAMFGEYSLGEMIRTNDSTFDHLHVFGRANDISHKKYIINGERDKQAIATDFIYSNIGPKLLNYEDYTYKYDPYDDNAEYKASGFIKTNDENWFKLSYFKKESNRAVADQIKMKLKYLGLKIEPSSIEGDMKVLYQKNTEHFSNRLEGKRIKLAKMEHNRWNSFHYLNGFRVMEFIPKKEKDTLNNIFEAKKIHMCLVTFDMFKEKSEILKELGYEMGQFEGYDFMINEHIPLILANAGHSINKYS